MGADEQVVAGADQIDEKKEVVSDEAVDSLVVGHGVPRPELNDYLLWWAPAERAPGVIQQKNIGIGKELEIRI